MDITFADVKLTDMFKVVNVKRSILPSRQNYSIDVPSRNGSYYAGYKYNPRVFDVEIVMTTTDMNYNRRTLAWMLDLAEPSKLVFSDEADKVYYAVVDGDTGVDEVLTVGKGTIRFICFDPFAYATSDLTFTADSNGLLTVNNGGTAPTAPKFEIDFTSDCGYVALVSPTGIIQVGNPQEVDGTTLPNSERLLSVSGDSTSYYTVNTGGKVRTPSAVIQGAISSNGYTIRPSDYGTDTDGVWHGMTMRRDIGLTADGTSSAQYWESTVWFSFKGTSNSDIGRFEFNIMDESNNFLAGFTMNDTQFGQQHNIPQFYVGNTMIWEDSSSALSKWNDFSGKVTIRKSGNTFYFEIQKLVEGTNQLLQMASQTYYDTSNTYGSIKAKTVNMWFGKFGLHPQVGNPYISYLSFRKDNVDNFINIPNLFGNGDKLIIDCNTSHVYLNNALFMTNVDIGSKFFELIEGQTEIQLLHSSFGSTPTATATITEKFL